VPVRAAIFLSAALAALATSPVIAAASTTVGSSLRQRADLYVRCTDACTDVQTARPGGASLRIPVDGVITRWRLRAATLGTVRLRVVRMHEDGTFETVAVSDPARLARAHRPGQDVLYRFDARIPVSEGDRIALDHDRTAGGVFHSYGADTSYATATFAPALGSAPAVPSAQGTGRELLLAADVEHDIDGDGFGDETQDNCPTIANDQTSNPCPPGTAPPSAPSQAGSAVLPGAPPGGTAGPLVTGEGKTERSTRAHRSGTDVRRAPKPAVQGPAVHDAAPPKRAAPVPRSRRDSVSHTPGPGPRQSPAPSRRDRAARHGAKPAARAPASRQRNGRHAHSTHPSSRPAPARRRHVPTSAHRPRPARPAPPPPPAPPGFHSH
jgi:hypothetical protein